MRLIAVFTALVIPFLVAAAVQAQQPRADEVDIDLVGCAGGLVEWIDGTQVATKIEVAKNGIVVATVNLVDVVGDQSGNVYGFRGDPGDVIIARLYVNGELSYTDSETIPVCPTATATSTPTNTATPAATNTPAPTATSTPVPPVPTPIVVVQERVVTVEVPVVRTVIQPPSTGDAGLAD